MKAQNHVQMSAQEPGRSTVEQESSDGMREKFVEPQGWALKWDGFALFKGQDWHGVNDPPPTDETR